MSEKFRRYFLKTKEIKTLSDEVAKLGIDLEKFLKEKAKVEVIEFNETKVYLLNGKPLLANVSEKLFPTLLFMEYLEKAPKVVVDMGAVPHVCNGADVMAPGIKQFMGDFRNGDLVLVVDEKHGKPLAVGEALLDKEVAAATRHGKIIRNVHFVGDKVWNAIKRAGS
ncbi:MAG: RNA-binding protein [Candidatus Bathyarchaeia archaeon]